MVFVLFDVMQVIGDGIVVVQIGMVVYGVVQLVDQCFYGIIGKIVYFGQLDL